MNQVLPNFSRAENHPLRPSEVKLLEKRSCPVCNQDRPHPVLSLTGFQFFTDDAQQEKRADVHHVQCQHCFALYMNPTYTAAGFQILFERAAQSYGASVIRKEEQLGWLRDRELLTPGLTYLDVGCYRGDFLASLPDSVRGIGVDIDSGVIAEAQARYGGPQRSFIAADFETFSLDEAVDVITMFHVLEHLPNPLAVLKKLRALARNQTRLVVEVPVLELGKTNDVNGYLTVSHLTHFSVNTLSMVLAAAGWSVTDQVLQPTYNGYRIVAVPTDPSQVTGDDADLGLFYDYIAHYYSSLHQVVQALDGFGTSKRRVLWGAGFHTELIYQQTRLFGAAETTYLLVDKDAAKQGQSWRGVAIAAPEVLAQVDWKDTDLVISSYGNQEEIAAEALSLGVPKEKIHRIYAFIRRY